MPYPRASHIAMSYTSHQPSPLSLRHMPTHQILRTLASGPTSETSKTQRTPSTVGWPERATSRRSRETKDWTLERSSTKSTTIRRDKTHPQPSRAQKLHHRPPIIVHLQC